MGGARSTSGHIERQDLSAQEGQLEAGQREGSEGSAEESTEGHRDDMVFLTHRP